MIGNELAIALGANGDRTVLTGQRLSLLLFDAHHDWGNKNLFSDFVNLFNALDLVRETFFGFVYVEICSMDEIPVGFVGAISETPYQMGWLFEFAILGFLDAEFMLTLAERLNSSFCMSLRVSWNLFLRSLGSRMALQRMGDGRECFVWSSFEVDIPEMWSFPFKGGGDDAFLNTVFVMIVSQSDHVLVCKTLTCDYSLIRVNTWLLTWCEYGLINNCSCKDFVVRRIWIISWSRAYSYFCTGGLSCLLGVLTQSLLLSVRWLELSVGLTYHLFRKVSRLDSVVRGRYLISCFTAHLVPGLHNMHWMDRNEVRMRFSEVFSVLSLCVKSATHLEQLSDALG